MDSASFGGYVLKGTLAVLQLDVDVFQIVAVSLLDTEAAFVRQFGEDARLQQRERGAGQRGPTQRVRFITADRRDN